MQKRLFKQLNYRDRQIIQSELKKGTSLSKIAIMLGKNKSTLSREIKRNFKVITAKEQIRDHCMHHCLQPSQIDNDQYKDLAYWSASTAEHIKSTRLNSANKVRRRKSDQTIAWVIKKIKLHWSPEQIAGRAKDETGETLSHEYVYSLIKKNKSQGGNLHRYLKRYGRRKQRFNVRDYKNTIPNRICIEERPEIVNFNSRIGESYFLELVSKFPANKLKILVPCQKSCSGLFFRCVKSFLFAIFSHLSGSLIHLLKSVENLSNGTLVNSIGSEIANLVDSK